MLCNDFFTTVVLTDLTIFSLFLLEFPAVLVWSSCCCDDVTIVGKRFRTVAADSGFSSFLMLKSTANFNLKKTSPFVSKSVADENKYRKVVKRQDTGKALLRLKMSS